MKKDTKIYLTLGIIVILIILGIFWAKSSNETPEEKTMKCIANKSVLYVATGCGFCAQQEAILSNYSSLINTVDCIKETQKCVDNKIQGTPTWSIDNKNYPGLKTIQQLKEITGC